MAVDPCEDVCIRAETETLLEAILQMCWRGARRGVDDVMALPLSDANRQSWRSRDAGNEPAYG